MDTLRMILFVPLKMFLLTNFKKSVPFGCRKSKQIHKMPKAGLGFLPETFSAAQQKVLRPVITFLLAVAPLLATVPGPSLALPANPSLQSSQEFLTRIKADEKTGLLTPGQSLLYRFQYAFAPAELPEVYQVAGFSPLKCGTDLIRQFHQMKDRLDLEIKQEIDGYLALPESRLSYLSSEGHFQITYELEGVDAVPEQDVDPVNGIPDFVEKAGQYLELAWDVEILMSGFRDPLIGGQPCQVSFRSMQNYGYTYVANGGLGTTGIVMHHNFLGFPPNDDPEGSIWGAAKVTAAHEFKHASQYAGSQWSEGGWIELDAVWVEDLVFDQTNDYYNYLIGGSPIRHPEIPLDGGTTETGSYEDCIFQTWLQDTWGVGLIVEFWQRRAVHPAEPVLATYSEVLAARGQDFHQAWGHFTGINYATGYRALPGLGYEEASDYPNGPVVADLSDYPAGYAGSVEHLAADFVRLLEVGDGSAGSLEVELTCDPGADPLTVTLLIGKNDGTGVLEQLDLQGGNQVQHTATVPLQEIQTAAVVVGNPDFSGFARGYQITVSKNVQLPVPSLVVATPEVQVQVAEGSSVLAQVLIGNDGQDDSVLHFQASVWEADPGPVLQAAAAPDKNISGSSLGADLATYLAGSALTLTVSVHNASTDDEWLTDVQLTFPAGVTLTEATPFSGGSLGDLIWSGSAGDGVTTTWHGEYGSQAYGVIRDGETAVAQLELHVAMDFSGHLTIAGSISGDQFGSAPHTVSSSVTLVQVIPQLEVTTPEAGQLVAMGTAVTVAWQQDGTLDTVDVSLSRDGGQSWENLAEVPAGAGNYEWAAEGPASVNCLVRVSGLAGLISAVSPGRFTIYPAAAWVTCQPLWGEVDQGSFLDLTLQCAALGTPPGALTSWLVLQHDGTGPPGVIPLLMEVVPAASPVEEMPLAAGLQGIFPNPFNPWTEIRFSLDRESEVELEILDVRGCRVCRLVAGTFPRGSHQVKWAGRDDKGRIQPAGVYLVRMRTPDFTATGKMVLAK